MKLLIDADFIVYKSCAACENEADYGNDVIVVTSKFSDAYYQVTKALSNIRNNFLWDLPEPILFFSDSRNFRKKIYPDYKGHRNRKKPCGYRRVINALANEYEVITYPELEADDGMGIYATTNPGNIVVSPDKDLRQIPGRLYNMDETMMITPTEGAKWHLIQAMAGDQTDGYSGVPGIGIKRAVSLMDEHGYSWKTVVKAFEDKDMTEDDALMNARLARILTCTDYDEEKKAVIPWTPAADYRIDDGAGVQTAEDG